MPREAEPSINERAFILQALQEDIRLDGRPLDAYRPLDISFGDDYGVADVQLGKTRVLTRVSASITAPYPDRKFDGIFTITTELSPIASPAFETGRQSDLEHHLTTLLETTFRRSSALPTESLCLLAGKTVWSLRLDIHVLSHDGSLLSCASLSALAALRHFRLPDTSVRGGGELTIYDALERDPVPLAMLHHPLCVSLRYFERGGKVVVDALVLLRCEEMAVGKVRELGKIVDGALELDAKRRDKGGMSGELQAENER